MVSQRLLLYVDILGFSDLVLYDDVTRVEDLYEVVASLNAFQHDAFKCIVFSDTILIYNVDGGEVVADVKYLLMFMCEFAKDLLHRLTKRGIVFRAVITYGDFRHYELNSIPCFFGTSLIQAHRSEKAIKGIGLFMDVSLTRYSDIFKTRRFNDGFHFVYLTQALEDLESTSGGSFPFDKDYLEQTDLIWMATPELLHLVDLYKGAAGVLPPQIKRKYVNTVRLYEKQYPVITSFLKANNLEITAIAPSANWHKVIGRHPEAMSHAIKKRVEF